MAARREQGWVRQEWVDEPDRRVPAWARLAAFVIVCAVVGALVSTLVVQLLRDDSSEEATARVAALEQENAQLRAQLEQLESTTTAATTTTAARAATTAPSVTTVPGSAGGPGSPGVPAAGGTVVTSVAGVTTTVSASGSAAAGTPSAATTTTLAAGGASATPSGAALDPATATCTDFATWDDADNFYWDQLDLHDGQDVTTLDPDGDSFPCEERADAPVD